MKRISTITLALSVLLAACGEDTVPYIFGNADTSLTDVVSDSTGADATQPDDTTDVGELDAQDAAETTTDAEVAGDADATELSDSADSGADAADTDTADDVAADIGEIPDIADTDVSSDAADLETEGADVPLDVADTDEDSDAADADLFEDVAADADVSGDAADGDVASDLGADMEAGDDDAIGDADAEETELPPYDEVENILGRIRENPESAVIEYANTVGWPIPVDGGYLFVNLNTRLNLVAGDFDGFAGTATQLEDGFRWAVVDARPGQLYKFTDLEVWEPDPYARAFHYDQYGEISDISPAGAHLERLVAVTDGSLEPRSLRIWVPAEPVTHLLYAHDGQNLFDPGAFWGGWRLNESAPPGMMIVGIDNTSARMDEYTHTTDIIEGVEIGGGGQLYASYVQTAVRPLIRDVYGEPEQIGVMGSSLGGLISFYIAHLYPGEFDFAASLSGTMGWGQFYAENPTMQELYEAAGYYNITLYLDSGGYGDPCDMFALQDDNYCENNAFRDSLAAMGWTYDLDLWHWYEPFAEHNEFAWASRAFRPLNIFAATAPEP